MTPAATSVSHSACAASRFCAVSACARWPSAGYSLGQVGHVAVDEAVGVDGLEAQVQREPQVVDRAHGVRRGVEQFQPLLEAPEQPLDDQLLGLEVVVQVAGADLELGRDPVRRHGRESLRIEQRQAGLQDAFARVGAGHGLEGSALRPQRLRRPDSARSRCSSRRAHLLAQCLDFLRARHAQALQRGGDALVEHVLELADAEAVEPGNPRVGAASRLGCPMPSRLSITLVWRLTTSLRTLPNAFRPARSRPLAPACLAARGAGRLLGRGRLARRGFLRRRGLLARAPPSSSR